MPTSEIISQEAVVRESTKGEMVRIAEEFGRHLIGRGVGAEIRRKFFSGEPSTWPGGLDFSGVEQATESGIDEIFGQLVATHGFDAIRNVAIQSATPSVQSTIEYVFEILQDPPTSWNAVSVHRLLSTRRRKKTAR